MYGPPGNGKSSISNGIRDAMGDKIYVPRAIEYAGQVITVYDPIVHSKAEEQVDDPNSLRRRPHRYDTRYVQLRAADGHHRAANCRSTCSIWSTTRPRAPTRRRCSSSPPAASSSSTTLAARRSRRRTLVNRWIVPLEEGKDILALQSGEKFEVPFDTLVIFSTNFHPNEIFDQAALRRIFFKIKIDGPSQENFLKIFAMVAKKKRCRWTSQRWCTC